MVGGFADYFGRRVLSFVPPGQERLARRVLAAASPFSLIIKARPPQAVSIAQKSSGFSEIGNRTQDRGKTNPLRSVHPVRARDHHSNPLPHQRRYTWVDQPQSCRYRPKLPEPWWG